MDAVDTNHKDENRHSIEFLEETRGSTCIWVEEVHTSFKHNLNSTWSTRLCLFKQTGIQKENPPQNQAQFILTSLSFGVSSSLDC